MRTLRNVAIVALMVVALGMAWWCLSSKGFSHHTQGQMARPESLSSAASGSTAASKAAARPEPRPPTAEAAATPSDRADKSEKTTVTSAVTAGPATAQQPATAPVPAVIAASVARFADAAIPVSQRMAEIEQLGKSGDAGAVQTLMKLGDTYTYLNFKAVEALGNVKTPEVARYLEGKTGDKDPKIVAGAMQSLARVQGAEAIPAIAVTIAANRQRPDGFQDTVCAAGVKALGEIGSPKAIPVLAEEFEKTVGKTLQHEYGSQVVAAFKAIGDPAGVPALEAYAQRLQTQRDAMGKNPMGQRYLEAKIKEVRDVIAALVK